MPHIRSKSSYQSKEKWENFGIAGLGLSLDVLIYIIGKRKPKLAVYGRLLFL